MFGTLTDMPSDLGVSSARNSTGQGKTKLKKSCREEVKREEREFYRRNRVARFTGAKGWVREAPRLAFAPPHSEARTLNGDRSHRNAKGSPFSQRAFCFRSVWRFIWSSPSPVRRGRLREARAAGLRRQRRAPSCRRLLGRTRHRRFPFRADNECRSC